MFFVSLYRIFKFAGQGFWRNFWLSLATISIIILTFIAINFLITLNILIDTATNSIKDKIDVSIYFKNDISESQILEVKTYLNSLTQVKELSYISQTQVLENFRKKHQREQVIIESLEELEESPLGATLIVKAKEIRDYPTILQVLDNSKYNDWILDKNFDDHKEYINRLNNISENIRKVGVLTISIFLLIAALIVFNTIRVAIYTHREEINIMKLVGAANWFIRGPFILEGIFYGLSATALGIAIMYPLLNLIQPYINNFFLGEFDLINHFNQNFWQIFGLELLGICFLNMLSSSIALRKYLRS